ncbi:MAG: peptidylprolyl isomerase [Paludibacter sp.]|nr:peptidylprolyl isomerase [Paludibacter sp.]MDD4198080.1 peptidylprolyl isomerase [Paludibacter sp.]MDD4427662.1 peptidylprolyl isomerase [Paludibacter sp.]
MHTRFIVFLTVFLGLSFINTSAQTNIIDEIIWIVGDESILRSEVEEQRIRAQYEGVTIDGDPYCVIPEQIAIQKLYLHQAELDSIEVNEGTVMNQVEMRMNYFISQIGSKEKLEEYFGKSMLALREDMRTMVREQMIIQQMQQKLVENIKSTPADVRRFYNSLSEDSIPTVPAQVELQIISFQPPVPQEEIEAVKERLREYAERVNSGTTDFSILARLYSEDTESAKRGGELGFMGKGQLVPEFANVAFNLTDPKRVSRVVESEFGFHIIQLIEKRGDRINCRHILMKPKVSLTDKQKAMHKLDSVSNVIRSGKMTFEQGVMYFSQDKNSAMNAGLMLNQRTGTSKFEYQDLPQEVAKVVYGMNVAEISKPFTMIDPASNKEVVAVVKVKSKVDIHKANLMDDYQLLKNFYEETKKEQFLKEWIAKKQRETYISIDPAWQNCNFKYPGWSKK